MRAGRLEQVLEESISAYQDGRRSVAESLALYPDLASRLAPLLRTAAALSDNFDACSPPIYLTDRVRDRFLQAASDRVRARALTLYLLQGHRVWSPGQRLALGAVLAAALLALVVVTGALLSDAGSSADLNRARLPEGAVLRMASGSFV